MRLSPEGRVPVNFCWSVSRIKHALFQRQAHKAAGYAGKIAGGGVEYEQVPAPLKYFLPASTLPV